MDWYSWLSLYSSISRLKRISIPCPRNRKYLLCTSCFVPEAAHPAGMYKHLGRHTYQSPPSTPQKKKKKRSFNSVEILLKDSSVCLCEFAVDVLEYFSCQRSFSRTWCQGAQQKLHVPSLEYYELIWIPSFEIVYLQYCSRSIYSPLMAWNLSSYL